MTKPIPGGAGPADGVASPGPSRLIIVVDDDPEIRSAVRLILPKHYEVVGLAGGEEFLEIVQAYQPDLIVLDVRLPGRDGFMLCRELRRHTAFRRIPVIFLTALCDRMGSLMSSKAGGDAYLMKPFGPEELLGTIDRLLEQPPV